MKKISNKTKLITLLILLLAIVSFLFIMIIKKDINKESFMVISISKINKDKDWVYDGDYDYTKYVSKTSYTTDFDKTYYIKDIIVPYINIDSVDAKNANANILNSAITLYNAGVANKVSFIDYYNYEYNNINNVISLVIKYGTGGTDVVQNHYKTYNYSLNDGKNLSYKEVYTFLNYKSININKIVKKAITNKMKEELKDIGDVDFNTYNNESYNNYIESVENNTISYFIDKNKKLNIIVNMSIPVGIGSFDKIITINN